MNLFRISLSLLLIALYASGSFAQRSGRSEESGDEEGEVKKKIVRSPDSAFVSYFSLNEQGAYTRYTVSKPLNQFQEYDVAKQHNQLYANLGNPGSASDPLFFSLKPSPDFHLRYDVFEPYKLKDDSIKLYISDNPFTHLRYHLGPAKEQKLDINFAHRIGNGIYLGLNARFANAPGIYLQQRAFNTGATLYAAFLYPTQRYGALVTYRTDRAVNEENGGITDISDFTQNLESNRKLIPVNLSDAMNRSKGIGVVVQQYFNILKSTVVRKIDTATMLVPRKFDAGRIIYTLKYSRMGTGYEDVAAPGGFYPPYFAQSDVVSDTILLTHFENCFVYSNEVPDTLGKSFPLQYSFGLRFQTDKLYSDSTLDNVFRQTVPFGMLKGIIKKKTFFKASAFLVLGGYKGGDYSLDGSFYQFFGKMNHKLYLNVSKGLTHPDYYFTSYKNDYFNWNYTFSNQNYLKGEFGVILRGYDMNASYTRMSNYVYLNQQVLPQQYSDGLNILAGRVSKEFRFRHWLTNVYVAVQQITPDSILQLPVFTGKVTLCYDVVLFNNALHAQAGVSGTYHSEWYQDAYMPALRSFYRQDRFISGNYPYLDVFVNMNIKRARIFVKYEHFNAGLMNYSYIMVPDYPQADAAFKFGISWLFFD